ncbi:hypothetical protein AB0A77_33915 [Streptomyces varsoviensis]|uniref:hypothetical protein n=1 Tax=Streptomyces varsoviensis TaxID=67373 RepID=UPI0033F16BA1
MRQRSLAGLWCDVERWWSMYGQFSRPVRAVWPSRRRVYDAVASRCAEPDYYDVALRRITLRIKDIETASGKPDESRLLRRLLGPEGEQIMRRQK